MYCRPSNVGERIGSKPCVQVSRHGKKNADVVCTMSKPTPRRSLRVSPGAMRRPSLGAPDASAPNTVPGDHGFVCHTENSPPDLSERYMRTAAAARSVGDM